MRLLATHRICKKGRPPRPRLGLHVVTQVKRRRMSPRINHIFFRFFGISFSWLVLWRSLNAGPVVKTAASSDGRGFATQVARECEH